MIEIIAGQKLRVDAQMVKAEGNGEWRFMRRSFSCTITNPSNETVTSFVDLCARRSDREYVNILDRREITLGPSGSYSYSWTEVGDVMFCFPWILWMKDMYGGESAKCTCSI